jgi:hypothetical protein
MPCCHRNGNSRTKENLEASVVLSHFFAAEVTMEASSGIFEDWNSLTLPRDGPGFRSTIP